MLFNRLFKRRPKPEATGADPGSDEAQINQGVYYLYLIIAMQIGFVFAIVAVIMFVGKVLSTPMWVFLFATALGVGGCVYIYRKAKRKFQSFRDTFNRVDLSDRNYEISFMGGMLTMRVEQNSRKLLEAPPASPILDAEAIDTPVIR